MSIVVPPMRCYLVEWYRPECTDETLGRIAAKLDDCAASVSAEGAQVRLVTMLAVPADEVLFGVFACSSEHLVAQACRRAGFPAQRLSAAIDARTAQMDRHRADAS